MSVTSHRSRNPRGHGDRLREELLEAAARLIAEEGSIDRVSLRAVAGRAGVSPTAVYRHFEDHADLSESAVLFCWNAFDEALEASSDPELDPFTDFRRMGAAYAAFAHDEPGKYQTLFATHNTMGDKVKEASMLVFAKLVDRVAAMLAANHDDRDPFFVATQVHTWIHGIVELCTDADDSPFPPSDVLIDDLAVRLGLVAAD
ncbi:MAG: TetR/AcrR family transcriptional regulator [Acidimicrobiia bacterium]|nr:TetR/AcrR family transcriptional regulator [Acidimicrobiia bacterium]